MERLSPASGLAWVSLTDLFLAYLDHTVQLRRRARLDAARTGPVWSAPRLSSDMEGPGRREAGRPFFVCWSRGCTCGWRVANQPRSPVRLSSLVILGLVASLAIGIRVVAGLHWLGSRSGYLACSAKTWCEDSDGGWTRSCREQLRRR
jgi:hypothetical protein